MNCFFERKGGKTSSETDVEGRQREFCLPTYADKATIESG
ncbi:hypothetical protein SUBVAR_04846 [Subdoligranulum variabile DSM 15176]|uniref:Uncharacterized protein n=1 Tax=Subdoligranulum variabile DSM 15176 TaxID=411471 RepID=D1PKH0_9FIRM|nr:hypothetical protein SUBVAR_04846 [Subdoligranulum variabile DSM 15176]